MEEKQDLLSKMSQKAQEALQSETAQKAKEKAKDFASTAAQKAQEAMQSETAQKAKAAAGAAAQQAQRAVSEAVTETAQQAQQVYSAAAAGEGLAAVKKAKFSKKTVLTLVVLFVVVVVILGVIGKMSGGGGGSEKDFYNKMEKLLDSGYEIKSSSDLGMPPPDGMDEMYFVIHKATFDKNNPQGGMLTYQKKDGVTNIRLYAGTNSNNPAAVPTMVAGGTALMRAVDSSISEGDAQSFINMGLEVGAQTQTFNGNEFYAGSDSSGYTVSVTIK